jgi:hypothetical protein
MGSKHLLQGVPRELDGNLPVNLQDQDTPTVNWPLHIDVDTGQTLVSDLSVDDTTIEITDATLATAGHVIILRNGVRFFAAGILSKAVNVLTIDTPVDYAYTVANTDVTIGNPNLNAVGSLATPIEAHVDPPTGTKWDVTNLHVILIDNSPMDFTTFGGISPLANGLVYGKTGGNFPQNIANAKSNGDLIALATDHWFEDKIGGGEFSLKTRYQFGGQGGSGVVQRVDGSLSESIRLLIQDDLSAISSVRFIAIGHVVED